MVSYFPVSYNFIKNETLPIEGEKTETPHTQSAKIPASRSKMPTPAYLSPSFLLLPTSTTTTTAHGGLLLLSGNHRRRCRPRHMPGARTHDSKRESGKKHHGISPRICPNPKSS